MPRWSELPAPIANTLLQRATLKERDHRPYPLPSGPWVMGQSWEWLAFLHWRVSAQDLSAVLPPGVEPDEHDGSAWIGVTPFVVRSVRARYMPALPFVSTFPELNVRTYVTYDGMPGIWFLSLDTPNRVAVAAARKGYRLPYHRARAKVQSHGDRVSFRLTRADGEARFYARYGPTGPAREATAGPFERFACERYCLYTLDDELRLQSAQIHHPPWLVRSAVVEIETNTMARPYGVELEDEPVAHYARKQDVLIWPLKKHRTG